MRCLPSTLRRARFEHALPQASHGHGAFMMLPSGLTQAEALLRQRHGQGNTAAPATGRSYRDIVVENAFTFINFSVFGLALLLALLGRPLDAVLSCGAVTFNIVIGIVQEVRAKRTLDQIALLARPTAQVIRDGLERTLAPTDLVLGDVIKIGQGDQVVVDGTLLHGRAQLDESQLTGESNPVAKHFGDELFSGSFCISGSAYFEATRVGANCFVNQVTSGARASKRVLTPLQRLANLVIRILLLVVLYFQFLLVLSASFRERNLALTVENAALLAGLVPNGLLVAIALAYALAAVKVSQHGALVQQTNAIESLSNVDVLCLDKTGTLTTNRLRVHSMCAFDGDDAGFKSITGTVVASMSGDNKTSQAIAAAFPAQPLPAAGETPFSSARKWSAVALNGLGVFALGAPEMLQPFLAGAAIDARVRAFTQHGLRVLLLAHWPEVLNLHDDGDDARLPCGMRTLGLIVLSDELRPEAQHTLDAFRAAGVHPKIISGDSIDTVAALARQAGLEVDGKQVTGAALAQLDEAQFAIAAASNTVFGRIAPRQKEQLVRALRASGHYVAMIGDGVNDVLALKQAQVGIAMQSGSQAARGVADIVLTDDSFAALLPAVLEGQRIVNGMHAILRLFLTRILTITLVILPALVVGPFPLSLRQTALLAMLVAGIPSTMLALWARPGPIQRDGILSTLMRFVIPPTLIGSALGMLVYATVIYGQLALAPAAVLTASVHALAQSALTAFLTFCGLALIVFLEPPTHWWTGGAALSGDRRPTLLALGLACVYVLLSLFPPTRDFYGLVALSGWIWLTIAAGVALWIVTLRWFWRAHILERFLEVTGVKS
jgi:cation-transporting P-type ATPase E